MEQSNPEPTDNGGDTTLEEKAYADLDVIATLSKHALAELDTGELDELEATLRSIHDRASAWNDPGNGNQADVDTKEDQ